VTNTSLIDYIKRHYPETKQNIICVHGETVGI